MKRFLHPNHARGLKSQDLDRLTLGPLTDRRIRIYILAGKYGDDMKEREQRRLHQHAHARPRSQTFFVNDL